MTRTLPTDAAARRFPASLLRQIVEALNANADASRAEEEIEAAFRAQDHGRAKNRKETADRLYGVFKVLADPQALRGFWQGLRQEWRQERPSVDRDRAVLRLWHHLELRYAAEVEALGATLSYHRAWLLGWFLQRYDVRRARRAAGGGRVAANAHLLLFAGALGLLLLRGLAPGRLSAEETAAAGLALYALTWWLAGRGTWDRLSGRLEAGVMALQTLLPRLAGACAVGLLLLASSEELLTLVVRDVSGGWQFLPLAIGCAYLLLEMTRRVHPLPSPRRLLLQGFDVGATALGHALVLTLVAEPGLRRILPQALDRPFGPGALTSVTVSVFVIGLVVNLIWAETPVTEPL